ncbi:MAG: tetratricopeptide repeat protein [Bacteroidia bacterium]|nr:tetratricopeptide repeat protein [Bacteroidia bacterium]
MREEVQWNWKGLWIGIPSSEKPYLQVAFVLLAFSCIWSFTGWLNRYNFSEALMPFIFQEERIEPIQEKEVNYRTYLIEAPVRWAYEVHIADILLPQWQGFGIGWLLMIVGWSALLGAASRATGFLPYLIYFAWVAWVFLSGTAQAWVGMDPWYMVSLALSLLPLLPIYLTGSGIWHLRISRVVLLTLCLGGLILGAPAGWRGWYIWYDSLTYPGIIAYAIGGIVGLQVPIALLTTLIYPPALRRQRMVGVWMLLSLSGSIILLLLFLPEEPAYTLTIALIAVGILTGLIGLQPYYPVLGSSLRQPSAFFWGWVALSLIALSTFGYHGWNHQDLYIYRQAELWRATLIGGIAGITIYLLWNFFPLWRAGKMTYWDLTKSMRFPLAGIYFLEIGSILWSEANRNWSSTRLPSRLHAVAQAESALLAGQWDRAEALYREALYILPYEAKANYNLGRLEGQKREEGEKAAERYERALLSKPFQPAALEASIVWLALDRPVRALQTLQRYYRRWGGDAIICNQLAFVFYKLGELDSAVFYWKEAIRLSPGSPQAYAHLALLYAQHERESWSIRFAQHIAKWKGLSSAVQENLAYLRLRGLLTEGIFAGWNAQWLGTTTDTSVIGRFIAALRRRALAEAVAFLPYFWENDPEIAPHLTRQVAIAFLEEHMPRRAAELFLSAKTPLDSLYAGYALAEAECWDFAYNLLSQLLAASPALQAASRREMSLLLSAAGQPQEALLIEPVESWTDMDYLRFAYYAYRRKNIQDFVRIIRPWIERGATYDAPYEWVARLFLLQGDTAGARDNIQAGLQRIPHSARLRLLEAEIALQQGLEKETHMLLNSTYQYLRSPQDTLHWKLLQLKLSKSPQQAYQLGQRFPGAIQAHLQWASHLVGRGEIAEAHAFLSQALEINPYDPELWRAYAAVAEKLGMQEEAEFARKKPDPCPSAL